jgi:hypothetical protein
MATKSKSAASQVTPGMTVLSEENYETLSSMLRSSDPADHLMAQHIMRTVDIQGSIFWIWKLARENKFDVGRMLNLRTKIGRTICTETNLHYLAQINSISFGSWLARKDWLNSDLVKQITKETQNGN